MTFFIEQTFFAKYKLDLESAKNINLEMFMATALNKKFLLEQKQEKKYSIDENGNAKFEISGVLDSKRDILDVIFGYAPSMTYPEIIESLNEIENDPSAKTLQVLFNTPGGYSAGVDEVAVALQMFSKPKIAFVGQQMASAGYYLGSQFDKIVATSEASQIGSIGTMLQIQQYEDEFNITSSDAPKKNPDPRSEMGRKLWQEQADEMQSLFLQRVSEGRSISIDEIKSSYGQGGVFLAKRALQAGMIDEIDTPKLKMSNAPYIDPTIDPSQETQSEQRTKIIEKINNIVPVQIKQTNIITETKQSSPIKGKIKENKKMDLETLRKDHPEVFALASKIGEEQEKERVSMINSYIDADPANEKLVTICKQAISEGKQFKSVEPQILVALRDGGKQAVAVDGNAPSVATSNVDPIQANAPVESSENAAYDVKSVVERMKSKNAFRGGL